MPEKQYKQRVTDLSNKLKQLIGGPEAATRYDPLIQENNLSAIMQECLQTKVRNMHQREILTMEKEYASNIEKMKSKVKTDLQDNLVKEIENLREEYNE